MHRRRRNVALRLIGADRAITTITEDRFPTSEIPAGSLPTVTVVITCYNYGRFLPLSVGSALDQAGVAVDVIVVDDASTDDSLDIARSLARADSRVGVIALSRNQGPVGAFNEGMAEAAGEYLVRLDADDGLTPGSLQRALALASRYPNVGLVYGRALHFTGEAFPAASTDVVSWLVWSGPSWVNYRCSELRNCITSPEVVMRTSVARRVGGLRELAHAHDFEMWLRMAAAADVGRLDCPDQAWHREHEDSRSALHLNALTDLEERAQCFELFLAGRAGPDAEEMRSRVRTGLAREAVLRTCRAYVRGWGGNATTDAYLVFAQRMMGEAALPDADMLERTLRLGPRRARLSPRLLVNALFHHYWRRLRPRLWEITGL
jgi:glycosyltransferase involved in cell wall biosynthesis